MFMSDHALIPIGHNKVKVPPHIFAIFPFVLSFIKVKRFHFHHFLDLEKVSLHPIQPLTSMILLMTLKLVKSHSLTITCYYLYCLNAPCLIVSQPCEIHYCYNQSQRICFKILERIIIPHYQGRTLFKLTTTNTKCALNTDSQSNVLEQVRLWEKQVPNLQRLDRNLLLFDSIDQGESSGYVRR